MQHIDINGDHSKVDTLHVRLKALCINAGKGQQQSLEDKLKNLLLIQ